MKVMAYDKETLDELCWRSLGNTDCLEQVIEMNPHALNSPTLTQGMMIELPSRDDITQTAKKPTITLWS